MAKVPLPYLSLRPLGNHLVQPLYFIGVETQAWRASDLSKDTQLVSSRAGNGPQPRILDPGLLPAAQCWDLICDVQHSVPAAGQSCSQTARGPHSESSGD